MQKKISILIMLLSFSSYGQEKDIFEDAQIEYEPGIEDDFEAIEKPDFDSSSSSSFSAPSHQGNQPPFSERDARRTERSISLFSGTDVIARVFHFNLYPQAHFTVWKMNGHLGLPLRFPVYDNIQKTAGLISRQKGFVKGSKFVAPRQGDFRTFFDAQRLVRHLEIGSEEEQFSLTLSRTRAHTLAYGDLLKDLVGEGLYDQDHLFASAHGDLGRVRVDSVLGPLIKPNILGINARFQPLSAVEAHAFVKEMNVDVSYVGDYFAPLGPMPQEDGAFVLNSERRLLLREEANAQAFSVSVGSTFFPRPWMSLMPYTSYSHLFLNQLEGDALRDESSYGAGVTLGHQASFYFDANKHSMLYFRSEGRLFSQNFQPNYFGDNYLLDRQTYIEKSPIPISKAQHVGFDTEESFRYGYYFELAYALDKIFNSKVAYENARLTTNNESLQPMRQFHWLSSLNINDLMSLHLAYQASSIRRMKELFDFDKSRGLLSLRGQIKLMQYLYFDTWVKHSFGINDAYQASEINIGDSKAQWLSNTGETRSLNFGLGVELAMTF
jgi:hypothetical protein